jgi:hypothetical protein
MDLADLQDPITLTERNTIKGKLYLNGVKSIKLNDILFFDRLKMKYDSAEVFDLEIQKNQVEISINWENFPPNPPINDFETITIELESVEWETIPTLFDPFR